MAISPLKVLLFIVGGVGAAAAGGYAAGVFDAVLAPTPPMVAALPDDKGPRLGERPASDAPAGEAAAPEAPAGEAPAGEAPQAAVPPPAAPEEPAVAVLAPTFDVLRVEPDGSMVVAGRASPGAGVEVIAGTTVIATATADADGNFVVVLDQPLKPGDYQIVLRSTTPDNVVATSLETALVSVPDNAAGEVLALVEEPGEPSRLITVPEGEKTVAAAELTPPETGPAPAVTVEPAGEQAVAAQPASTAEAPAPAGEAAETTTPPASEAPAATAEAPAETPAGTGEKAVETAAAEAAAGEAQAPAEDPAATAEASAEPAAVPAETGQAAAGTSSGPAATTNAQAPAVSEGETATAMASAETTAEPAVAPVAATETPGPSTATVTDEPAAGEAATAQTPAEPATAPVASTEAPGQATATLEPGTAAPAAQPDAVAEAPATRSETADTRAETGPGSETESEVVVAEAEAPKPETAPAPTGAEKPVVRVEAVEIEGRQIFVAGQATPGMIVRVYANADLLGETPSSPEGRFLVETERDLPVGDYIVRADLLADGGRRVVARAAVPFQREAGEMVAAVAPAQDEPRPQAPAEQPVRNDAAADAPAQDAPAREAATADASAGAGAIRDQAASGAAGSAASGGPASGPAAAGAATETPSIGEVTIEAEPERTPVAAPVAQRSEPVAAAPRAPAVVAPAAPAPKEETVLAPAPVSGGPVIAGTGAEKPADADLQQAATETPTAPETPAAPAPAETTVAEARPEPVGDGIATVTAAPLKAVDGAVIIRRGDSLWRISRRVYGRGVRYSTIYLANQEQIADPNRIWPGQVFRVPEKTTEGENADMRAIGDQATTVDPASTAQ